MKSQLLLSLLGAWIINISISSASPLVLQEPVGPTPAESHAPRGCLVVYSATDQKNDGDVSYFYHTGYTIYTMDGKVLQNVANHISVHDENPERVLLPVGTYKVEAESDKDGTVIVPVVIQGGRTTKVNLESSSNINNPKTADAAVKTPSGQIIGWRAGQKS